MFVYTLRVATVPTTRPPAAPSKNGTVIWISVDHLHFCYYNNTHGHGYVHCLCTNIHWFDVDIVLVNIAFSQHWIQSMLHSCNSHIHWEPPLTALRDMSVIFHTLRVISCQRFTVMWQMPKIYSYVTDQHRSTMNSLGSHTHPIRCLSTTSVITVSVGIAVRLLV